MATISTHNGSAAHREHNIRNEKVVSKEKHIDPKGHYEIWKDEKPREAYHKLFDKAVERYNAKQTREDRKIDDYYTKIAKDKKKHPVYEMIIGVYPSKGKSIGEEKQRAILKEFVDDWQVRNPNLYMCGAYYHADEEGEPHVHIDYIPVARGYTKGMDIQTGLAKALEGQGFVKQGKATEQIQWERSENEYLERLCRARGIKINHPKEEGRVHLDTERYKAEQRLKSLDNEIEDRERNIGDLEAHIGNLEANAKKTSRALKEAKEELEMKQEIIETMDDTLANLFTRFNKAYERMQKIFVHWLNNDQRIYTELVEKADKVIKKGNEVMESFLSKSETIFGKANQESLFQVKEESSKLEEVTEELEEMEDDYDYE